MIEDIQWSRPLRWASRASGLDEDWLKGYLRDVRVGVRLEPGFDHPDARQAFLLAVNMLLRFCPRLIVGADDRSLSLAKSARALGSTILQSDSAVEVVSPDMNWSRFDSVLTVGRRPAHVPAAVTINSNGWLARLSTVPGAVLPWRQSRTNAIGALAAACLGVGAVASFLLKIPVGPHAFELSLLEHGAGALETLDFGPDLPTVPLRMDAHVFGCGGVTNGWAYTIRRLPIHGRLEAVDKQSLREENLGPYVLSSRADLGRPKVELIKRNLERVIQVTPRPEPLEFHRVRLELGLARMPRMVVAGLDDILARHVVQRLWPDILIDMAGGGTTTQLVVHHAGGSGMCLLEALRPPHGTADFAVHMAAATGLSAERIRSSPTDLILEEDVTAAAPQHREALEAARRRGRPVCGRITDHNLYEEGYSEDFTPAVPFVAAFSGVVGASETMKAMMGLSLPLHHQFDFRTMRGRRLELCRSPVCECVEQRPACC